MLSHQLGVENMRSNYISSQHTARLLWRLIFWTILAIILLLASYNVASAQCVANPTGETAVGLQNASSYYLTFYIDGVRRDGVPPGDKSVDFMVAPGEHTLRADAVINDQTVSASRTANIPEGYVCTWTVTDSADTSSKARRELQDYLRLNRLRAFIPLVAP